MKIRNLIPFKTSLLSAPINKFLGVALVMLVLLTSSVASAQLFPVQVSPQLTPPYSLKLSDYSTSTTEKLLVNLLLTDVNESDLQVRLRFSISGNSVNIQSKDFVQNAAPIQLTGGIPLRLSNLDLQPYFDLQNLDGITPSEYSKPLPDGLYQFCFEVFDWTTGRPLSEKKCYPVYLVLNDPPFLNLPQNGEQVPARDPQNIIFQWTPRHVNATGVEYEFELRELWDTNVDPQAAFLASPNLYQTTVFANTLLYGPGETSLLEGKTYGWRVRAVVSDGISETAVFKNGGYSEIFYFTYTGKCDAPQYILAKSEGTTTEEITWQQNPDHINYQIQFRKEGGSNNVWFESETVETKKKLFFLEAETTYEYRVGGQCVQNGGYSYSAINTFTTPGKEDASEYNCGIPPEIVITNQDPLQQLGVNDVFTAGDFPVTVKEVNGGNGNYTGWGFIVVPYLGDTQIRVTFNNIQINTDKQLTNGIVETEYDEKFATTGGAGMDDIANELELLTDISTAISELFKKKKEILEQLSNTEDENSLAELVNNYNELFTATNEKIDQLINYPDIPEDTKKELEDLKISGLIASTDNLSEDDIANYSNADAHKEKRASEIATDIENEIEDLKKFYKQILVNLQENINAFIYCEKCNEEPSQSSIIGIDGTNSISMSTKKGWTRLKCVKGNYNFEEPGSWKEDTSKITEEQAKEELSKYGINSQNIKNGNLWINNNGTKVNCNTFLDLCNGTTDENSAKEKIQEALNKCSNVNRDLSGFITGKTRTFDLEPGNLNFEDIKSQIESIRSKSIYSSNQVSYEFIVGTERHIVGNPETSNIRALFTIDETSKNGTVNLNVKEDFLKNFETEWQKKAKDRGISADIVSLRIQSLEAIAGLEDDSYTGNITSWIDRNFGTNINKFAEVLELMHKMSSDVWDEGKTDESHWLYEGENANEIPDWAKWDDFGGGLIDGSIEEIVSIPQTIKLGSELISDPSKLGAFGKLFTIDGISSIVDGVSQDLSHPEKRKHMAGTATINVATMVFPIGKLGKAGQLFEKLTDISKAAGALSEYTHLTKFLDNLKKADWYSPDVKNFNKKFNELLEKSPLSAEYINNFIEWSGSNKGIQNFVDKLHRFKDIEGFDVLMKEITSQKNKFIGGRFVIDYAENILDNKIYKKIKNFELIQKGPEGTRIYDLVVETFDGKSIHMELKSWTKQFYTSNFRNQFLKDISNMTELGSKKWVFKKTSLFDNKTLKEHILESLIKNGKPIEGLYDISIEQIKKLFPEAAEIITNENRIDFFINKLKDDDVFNNIFELIDISN